MQMNDVDPATLRRLAQLKPDKGRVLSLYLNLDPSDFATPKARGSQVRALLDEASRHVRDEDGSLSAEDRTGLKKDLERVESFFNGGGYARGALGLAIFACSPIDLFEVHKLPRPVPLEVVIDDSPYVEPLAELVRQGDWGVLLATRRTARLLRGSPGEGFAEIDVIEDDVHRWHDQGGWSQARYQRGIEKEAKDHLKHAADVLFRRHKRQAFEAIVVGAPEELQHDVDDQLHPYLRERVVGHIEVEVEHASADQVHEAVAPIAEEYERKREREMLDRLAAGVGTGGRAAAGVEEVTEALNEQRVEALLLGAEFEEPGVVCKGCGWIGAGRREGECPIDGGELEQRDDLRESLVERAIVQAAVVVNVRFYDDLEMRGQVGALLRF
jgi:peptide subunit release factor 1 (eRF1)